MGIISDTIEQIRSMKIRQVSNLIVLTLQLILQAIQFGLIVTSALMMWRGLMLVAGNESPMVVVLSGSMEPSMYRGDILVLLKYSQVAVGDVVVYTVDG